MTCSCCSTGLARILAWSSLNRSKYVLKTVSNRLRSGWSNPEFAPTENHQSIPVRVVDPDAADGLEPSVQLIAWSRLVDPIGTPRRPRCLECGNDAAVGSSVPDEDHTHLSEEGSEYQPDSLVKARGLDL